MRQIIAMGGGGFSMEPDNLLLDQYVLTQVDSASPKVCFIPTASGDADSYIDRFYTSFRSLPCEPSHLSLFEPAFQDLEPFVLSQDILYVGGGNTRNMLVLWREWGLDRILRKAYEQGIVLTGLSAGSICWFQEGLTDPLHAPLYKLNALGFIPGSHCPHYDGEEMRRPSYQRLIGEGNMQAGYGVDDGAALHFINEALHLTVSSREQASAYYVERTTAGVEESKIAVRYLGAQ
ncbi:peptidase E [Paenibacillus sp. 1001270B_150601_E10]|uniref:Type 1 glutamine amidotransferase-like domain-containing protein n=1 Tax=Paenibacillus sp. 1001270B_150601_E10 TaxID=2787079 RepID=UPI0018A07325|nr:peptidase E [Paenibacillus sp. 1001270B_150601_E10]